VTDTAIDWALVTGASSGIGRALAAVYFRLRLLIAERFVEHALALFGPL